MDFEKEKDLNRRLVSPPHCVDLDEVHNPNCQKQPSSCRCCEETAWIWASSPAPVESIRWGMWLLFVEKKNVDKIWNEIIALLSKNQLGNVAKVSTADKRTGTHFICVYTYDFSDVPDVFRVLVTLRRMNHIENDFLDYVTEVNGVEEDVNGADFERRMEPCEKIVVRMYTSPSVTYYRGVECIQMALRKIRPESKFGLVAKLIQDFMIHSKGNIEFYNPPKIHLPFSTKTSPCTYDELVDYEDTMHELNCDKQPSTCYCEKISFIWAHQPICVDSHVGNWLLFPDKKNVDEIWEKVKNLTAANHLGIGAKVSNAGLMTDDNEHVIHVFVHESKGIQEFFRVLVTLRRMKILENDFLKYVTKVNDVEEATNGASKGTIVRMRYGSPPMRKDQTIESIRMYLLNLGPESNVGLVAELTNNSTECSEDVINFYNPPKNDLPFSTQTRPCKYDELVDFENDFHQPLCERQPSTCDCDFVSGIWAHQPISIDSIHGGKWMLYPEKENVDEIWEKVKILTAANRLGIGAKVQDGDYWDDHVICVYVHDSTDVQDVFRVLVTLRRNCLQNTFINYKTDNATLQKIYKINDSDQSTESDSAKNFEDVFLYFSPPSLSNSEITDEKEIIQLFKNNIDPGFKRGLVTLVAELEKEPHDLEAKISFYDPPRILHPFDRSLGFVPKNQ
ncbi:uncharacterized protein LOC124203628 isoform X2 [Daphnia pulex]|nr:uncharacterized protein LOC124203628 isoform X2 [Daphnia pulex]